jgi:hypothetical protein
LAIKKFWFLIAHKKSNFPIGYWFDFFFLLTILILKLENKYYFCSRQHFCV